MVKVKGIAELVVPMFTAPKPPGGGAVTTTGLTVSTRKVGSDSAPEVPMTVTVASPRAAVPLAVSVSVLVPVVGFGVNDAVTPLGKFVAASWTLPANPYKSVTVIRDVPEPPWTTEGEAGEASRLKLGAGLTVSASGVVAIRKPEFPDRTRLP
jgi:hypothetical protein